MSLPTPPVLLRARQFPPGHMKTRHTLFCPKDLVLKDMPIRCPIQLFHGHLFIKRTKMLLSLSSLLFEPKRTVNRRHSPGTEDGKPHMNKKAAGTPQNGQVNPGRGSWAEGVPSSAPTPWTRMEGDPPSPQLCQGCARARGSSGTPGCARLRSGHIYF